MAETLVGLDLNGLSALLGPAEAAYRSKQIYQALYRDRVRSLDAITTVPRGLRERLSAAVELGWPEQAARYDSADGTRRYLLTLADGRTVEAVLMPEPGRHTLCISSQVGCPVNCRFCLTALMGLERNLTAGEIVGQVLFLLAEAALDPHSHTVSIVMMGQGEPLLNLDAVLRATRILADKDAIGFAERRLTVSTAGIIPKMVELGRAPVRPKLAVSLNASTDEQRRELMPITRKYPLRDLLDACRAYPLRPWERLTFEYVLLKGVNDTDADARRVARLIAPLKAKVNLIALNPGPGIPFQTPDADRVLSFQSLVRKSAPCFIRKPRGLDVYAACGQLKRMESATGLVTVTRK